MMRGMNKRRKHSCVNTLNKSLLVNTFIGNLNMPSLEKGLSCMGGVAESRNAIHTTSYHGSISQTQLCTHTLPNAIPMFTLCRLLFAQTLLPSPVASKADLHNCDSSSGDLTVERCIPIPCIPILQSTIVTVVEI